jgi:hypothetical protein
MMVVVATARVEGLVARWAARVALHVLTDGQLRAARAAEYGFLIPFVGWPNLDRMSGEGIVAILAGIVNAATFHLDGEDVRGTVIMLAAGLRVEMDATYVW